MEGLAVGRIVHFVTDNDDIVPAIVITVYENGFVNLTRFVDPMQEQTGALLHWISNVPYSEEPKRRSWHWPKRI